MVVAMVALVFGTCRLNNIHRLVFLITPFVLFELLETFTTDEKNKALDAMASYLLDATDTISVGTMFRGMATEIVEKPEDADVIVADHFDGELRQGQKLIRSCDYELIFEYLNVPKKKA